MAESSFLYDPSENINRGFAQFQAGLGNAFSQLIAQKQNDYVTAEKTFQNIDALTDKLGEYGQEEITGKTSALMNQAAKDIIKNGKLDYSALGDIRSEVTKIKNRKSAIEAGTQMLKDWTQTSLASKDDLTSLTTTLGDLRGILLNPNNLSASDMGRQMQAAYTKNINTTKVFGDVFKRIAPSSEFTTTVDKDGNRYQVGGTVVDAGFQYDSATGKFVPKGDVPVVGPDGKPVLNSDGTAKTVPYMQKVINDFKAQGAPAIAALRAQMGPDAAMLSDDQLIADRFKAYVDNNNIANKNVLSKDKNQLSTEESQATIAKAKAGNIDTEIDLGNQRDRAAIAASISTVAKNNAEMGALNSPDNFVDVNSGTNTKTGFLGVRLPMIAKDASGKPVNFIANNIVWKNGKEYYSGYKAPKSMGYVEANQSNLQGFEPIEIPVDSYNRTAFNASKGGLTANKKVVVNKAVNAYNSTPMKVIPVNQATPAQKARAAKEGKTILSMSQIRLEQGIPNSVSNADLYNSIVESAKGNKVLIIK